MKKDKVFKEKDDHQYIIVWEDELVEGEEVIVKFNTLDEAYSALKAYNKDNPEIEHALYIKLKVTE
jgi:hypothetical protein